MSEMHSFASGVIGKIAVLPTCCLQVRLLQVAAMTLHAALWGNSSQHSPQCVVVVPVESQLAKVRCPCPHRLWATQTGEQFYLLQMQDFVVDFLRNDAMTNT